MVVQGGFPAEFPAAFLALMRLQFLVHGANVQPQIHFRLGPVVAVGLGALVRPLARMEIRDVLISAPFPAKPKPQLEQGNEPPVGWAELCTCLGQWRIQDFRMGGAEFFKVL